MSKIDDLSPGDHGTSVGLGDDDHTQYALLLGRSGGQVLIGGTASGDDLTLQSTSDATKGTIYIGVAGNSAYDETNDRLGIGTASPGNKLTVTGASAGGIVSELRNTTDGTGASTLFRMGNDAAANLLEMRLTASSYTPSGYLKASCLAITCEGVGGVSIGAVNASGAVRIYSGGSNERLTVASDGGILCTNLKSGATQVAAGAAANELWVTSSHATLPDNVIMIGV